MKIEGLSIKIIVIVLISLVLFSVLFGVIIHRIQSKYYGYEKKRAGILLSAIFKQNGNKLADEIVADRRQAQMTSVQGIALLSEEILSVCLYRDNGEPILCSNDRIKVAVHPERHEYLKTELFFETIAIGGKSIELAVNPIEEGGRVVGYIAIFYDLTVIMRDIRKAAYIHFPLLIAVVASGAIILYAFLSRSLIRRCPGCWKS